jgi:phosphoadenosine phosphosulfate reductase
MNVRTDAKDWAANQDALHALSDHFETARPEKILSWALESFGRRDVALATGFGVEGCVLVSMLAETDRSARIFYLDTDVLFAETYALRDRLAEKYGVTFERWATDLTLERQASQYGARLWEREPDQCCRLRKVEPLRRGLGGLRAWITAIRRDQSDARRNIGIVEWDEKFGLVKINPLARWSASDVWNYVLRNGVPYNPMHDEGYPSIGCQPCTSPVQIGEDARAGRWRGKEKTECGLHA